MLDATVRKLQIRLTWTVLVNRMAACTMWALAGATLLAALDRLIYLNIGLYLTGAWLVLAGVVTALVWTAVRAPTRVEAARVVDQRLGLSDRMVSAVQLGVDTPWGAAIGRDLAARMQHRQVSELFPLAANWPARLILPLIILFNIVIWLPSLDLLGRMDREVTARVEAAAEARRVRHAVAAATEPLGRSNESTSRDPLGALRVQVMRIREELEQGASSDARHLELGEQLRKLAELMAPSAGGEALKEAIRRGAEELTRGGEEAGRLLRGIEEELAKLQEALDEEGRMSGEMQALAEAKRAMLRTADPAQTGSAPPTADLSGDEEWVELAPRAREPGDATEPLAGILYSPAAGSGQAAVAGYEGAARAAEQQIERGLIPPGHIELVRSYFTSIKPVNP